jgi:hypothetical protein
MKTSDANAKRDWLQIMPYLLAGGLALISGFLIALAEDRAARYLSLLLVIIILIQFCVFLFAMAREIGQRNRLAVSIFILVNVSLIISLFGNIFRWSGLKDTVTNSAPTRPLLDAIYFSVVTWTTLGYGDIVPSLAARPIAAMEALAGYLVMSLLIAVLLKMVQR